MKKIAQKLVSNILMISVLCVLFVSQVESQNIPFQSEAREGHPKIESALTQLLEEHTKGGMAASQEFARGHGIKLDQEGMITVFLLPEAGKTKETIDMEALKGYGGEIIKSGDHVIKAKVPILMLKEIADNMKGISFIKLPDKPHSNIISEGVNLTGTATYHSLGYYGQNVKVAVIDVGFKGLSDAIAYGELPNDLFVIDCTGSTCVPKTYPWDIFETKSHGTAVAEVIHDMAPGAQLYLIKIQDSLDLKDAKNYCIANGIRIVNHSAGWFNGNFYDGSCYNDNPVCTVNNANSNGILWVNSAGNHAKKHYEAIFSDPNGNGFHNVSEGNECISINNVNAGETILVYRFIKILT